MTNFKKELKKYNKKHILKKRLAYFVELTGKSLSTITYYHNGRIKMPIEVREIIADDLGISPDDLV